MPNAFLFCGKSTLAARERRLPLAHDCSDSRSNEWEPAVGTRAAPSLVHEPCQREAPCTPHPWAEMRVITGTRRSTPGDYALMSTSWSPHAWLHGHMTSPVRASTGLLSTTP